MTEGRMMEGREGSLPPSIKLPYPQPTTGLSVLWGPRVIKLVYIKRELVLKLLMNWFSLLASNFVWYVFTIQKLLFALFDKWSQLKSALLGVLLKILEI